MAAANVQSTQTRQCAFCHQIPEKIKICGGCHTAIYCGPGCQLVDWSKHKSVCKQQAAGKENNVQGAARSAAIIPQQKPKSAVQKMEEHLRAEERIYAVGASDKSFNKNVFWPQQARMTQFQIPLPIESIPKPGERVIDMGAGGGAETRAFLNFGCRVKAIDSFRGFAEHMSPLKREFPDTLEVAEELLVPASLPQDGSVSVILAYDILCYCSPDSIIPLLQANRLNPAANCS